MWGSPLVLVLTLVMRLALGNAVPFVPVFWIGFALIVAMALLPFAPERFRRWLLGLLGMACGAAVLLAI